MLVLHRRKGDAIIIEDNIEVRVLDISQYQVKIGIEAPRDVEIWRKEIYRAPGVRAVQVTSQVNGRYSASCGGDYKNGK